MILSEKIKNKLLLIKDKPKMVFSGDYNFYVLKLFMMGYMNGLGDAYSIDLNKEITDWYGKEEGVLLSVFVGDYIEDKYSYLAEEELKNKLIMIYVDFFLENADFFNIEK